MNSLLVMLIASVLAVLGWLIKSILTALKEIKEELHEHKLEDATIQTELKSGLESQHDLVNQKLDQILKEL